MPLKFDSPKGKRFLRTHFRGVTTGYNRCHLWWSREHQRWTRLDDVGYEGFSNYCDLPCKSVRAFRRRLRQWSKYLPAGTEFLLQSNYVGYNVWGKTSA